MLIMCPFFDDVKSLLAYEYSAGCIARIGTAPGREVLCAPCDPPRMRLWEGQVSSLVVWSLHAPLPWAAVRT